MAARSSPGADPARAGAAIGHGRAVALGFEVPKLGLQIGMPAPVFRGEGLLASASSSRHLFVEIGQDVPYALNAVVEFFDLGGGEIGGLDKSRSGGFRDVPRELRHGDEIHGHACDPEAQGRIGHNVVMTARGRPCDR